MSLDCIPLKLLHLSDRKSWGRASYRESVMPYGLGAALAADVPEVQATPRLSFVLIPVSAYIQY